ncbi:MAG: response regulator [Methylococcales bacterium]|nr:response regulator [Methylococcales bacterium]
MFDTQPPFILIVDDEPANLAAMREILGDKYQLVYAKNGASTLAAAEKHNLSLILLGINLPDMDGYEVCKQLKGNPNTEQIPIIFVTAMNSNQDEEIGLKAGAVDYITKPFSPAIVLARVRIHLSLVKTEILEESYRDAIYMLGAAGHYNDTDTGVHIWRMAAYAAQLADECGWGLKSKLLELAAPMHDTGKIGIPDAILRKPESLTPDEWVIMKTHSQIGYEILNRGHSPVFKMAAEIALYHHEKWDGSGYPQGLSGEAIPESARIVAIVDVFDALTMNRPYKKAWSVEEAVTEIKKGSGKHFEPRLVNKFESILSDICNIKEHWG